MKTKNIVILVLAVLIMLVGFGLFSNVVPGQSEGKMFERMSGDARQSIDAGVYGESSKDVEIEKSNCLADECLAVEDTSTNTPKLPDSVKEALGKALDDEYKALTTYQIVMDEFGAQRPFNMIARSEQMHIALLKSLYDKYNLAVPENPYPGNITAPDSVQSACQAGVTGEIENASLYEEELLPTVKEEYPDIYRAFEKLMNASQERHLPAFRRCS